MTKDADDRRRPRFRDFNAVQVHISLDDIEPRIWRRLIVPLDTTLADMHPIIQAAMGWKDAHLHEFEVGGLTYGDTWSLSAERTDDEARVYDAQEVRMRDFSREPGVTFAYVYDFSAEEAILHRRRALLPARGCRRHIRLLRVPARVAGARARRG
jgi:hypothetical protein